MGNDELPLPDHDRLPSGDLRHRVRSLTEEEPRRVLDHESEHGARMPVVRLLTVYPPLRHGQAGQTPARGRP